jgi:hypothetical protein
MRLFQSPTVMDIESSVLTTLSAEGLKASDRERYESFRADLIDRRGVQGEALLEVLEGVRVIATMVLDYVEDLHVIVGDAAGYLHFCSVEQEETTLYQIKAHDDGVSCMAATRTHLATGTTRGEVKLWSLPDMKVLLVRIPGASVDFLHIHQTASRARLIVECCASGVPISVMEPGHESSPLRGSEGFKVSGIFDDHLYCLKSGRGVVYSIDTLEVVNSFSLPCYGINVSPFDFLLSQPNTGIRLFNRNKQFSRQQLPIAIKKQTARALVGNDGRTVMLGSELGTFVLKRGTPFGVFSEDVRAVGLVSRAFAQVDAERCCMLISDSKRCPLTSDGVEFLVCIEPRSGGVIDGMCGTNVCQATSMAVADFRVGPKATAKKRMLPIDETEEDANEDAREEKSARIEL